jgi:uncharacterized Tic20 family protein
METETVQSTSEERLLGLFSHLSIFLGGIVLPIIFWALNKEKSKFVTYHSLQAIFFHMAYIAIIIMLVFILVGGGIGIGLLTAGAKVLDNNSTMPAIFVVLIVIFYFLLFVVMFGFIIYGIYMGVKAYQGELRRYPVIGNIVYRKVYGERR